MSFCKDQLAVKLLGLFRDTDSGYIDDAVAQAKRQLETENKQTKQANFKRLFDSQLTTLKDRGCPSQIIEIFVSGKQKVLDHAQSINMSDGNLPFAPVITPLYLGYHGIMSLVRHNGNSGYTHLDPGQITDEEKVPTGLYYQFDVENGISRLGKMPEVSDQEIRSEKRLRSTAAEVICIGTHTEVLSKQYMDAVGSRYGSGGCPFLFLYDDRPGLGWSGLGGAGNRWGAASCGSRLEL